MVYGHTSHLLQTSMVLPSNVLFMTDVMPPPQTGQTVGNSPSDSLYDIDNTSISFLMASLLPLATDAIVASGSVQLIGNELHHLPLGPDLRVPVHHIEYGIDDLLVTGYAVRHHIQYMDIYIYAIVSLLSEIVHRTSVARVAELAKGAGLKILSCRSSRVRIPSLAPSHHRIMIQRELSISIRFRLCVSVL